MLGRGVDISGLGQRPVTNTADRLACSMVGGIIRQQTTPVCQTLRSLFEFSLIGATRFAGGK